MNRAREFAEEVLGQLEDRAVARNCVEYIERSFWRRWTAVFPYAQISTAQVPLEDIREGLAVRLKNRRKDTTGVDAAINQAITMLKEGYGKVVYDPSSNTVSYDTQSVPFLCTISPLIIPSILAVLYGYYLVKRRDRERLRRGYVKYYAQKTIEYLQEHDPGREYPLAQLRDLIILNVCSNQRTRQELWGRIIKYIQEENATRLIEFTNRTGPNGGKYVKYNGTARTQTQTPVPVSTANHPMKKFGRQYPSGIFF